MRVKFSKGMQKKFLSEVMEKLNCPSMRLLNQFGLNIKYSSWKNYFSERRALPENLFNDLCELAELDKKKIKFEVLEENWGQVKGGKK